MEGTMKKSFIIASAASAICLFVLALIPLTAHHGDGHIMINPGEMVWRDGPASFEKGVQFTLIEGDWTQEGPFTARLKFPAGFRIAPHTHPAIEHVTVLKGSFHMGAGTTFDKDSAMKLEVGGFAVMPIEYPHYAFTTEETIIQLHGIGPWGINYINEDDDPRLVRR
jgi:quercetin dioxygenase-like cupin family protein